MIGIAYFILWWVVLGMLVFDTVSVELLAAAWLVQSSALSVDSRQLWGAVKTLAERGKR